MNINGLLGIHHQDKRLVINPIGGLANRMRAIAAGLQAARKLGLTPEIVWSVDKEAMAPAEALFDVSRLGCKVRSISPLCRTLLYDTPRKRNFYLSRLIAPLRFGRCFHDTESGNDFSSYFDSHRDDLKATSRDIMIQSGLSFHDFTPEFYRSLFHPVKKILDLAASLVNGDFSRLTGLHIRRTDNTISISKSPDILFFKTIEDTLRDNPKARFYLATDDEETKCRFTDRYGEEIILINRRPADRTTLSGIEDAMAEMIVLSKCERIYGSFWSSFSEAAAILGNRPFTQLTSTNPD